MELFFYKNLMVEISSEPLLNGKWQPQWWIWSKNFSRITRFFHSCQLNTEEKADFLAKINAKECIDKKL